MRMAPKRDGGAQWQGEEASSPEVTDKGEAERFPRRASAGDAWQGGPSRVREARAHLETSRRSLRLEEGRTCR